MPSRSSAIAALILGAVLWGCAKGGAETTALSVPVYEVARFQSLNILLASGPCPTGLRCDTTLQLDQTGRLVVVERGRQFEGRVPERALLELSVLAASEALVESLRKLPGCPQVIDTGEIVKVEIAPGIFVEADTAGCTDGPVVALRHDVRTVARQLFPELTLDPGPAVTPPNTRLRFQLRTLELESILIQRNSLHCAAPDACADRLNVNFEGGTASRVGPMPRGPFYDVADFEPLASVAVRRDVLAELRKPSPCPTVTDLSEATRFELSGRLHLRADSAGCSTGPIAEVREAAIALVERLAQAP